MIEKQLKEAEKLGFKKCIIPENNKKLLKEKFKLDIIGVRNIKEAMKGVRTIMRTNEKGITLLVLVITVILMAIIAGATINYGVNSLKTVELQNFNYELQQIQGKVDAIYEKIKLGNEEYIILGNNITDSAEAMNVLNMVKGINYSNIVDSKREQYYYQDTFTYYRYLTQKDLENLLGITSNPGDVIINFKTREVISIEGCEYDGITYYTLTDM